MKQKGITLDVANRAKITYDKFKELVLNITTKIESVERFQFRWVSGSRDVITTYIKKSIKSIVKDKRCIHGFDSYPYGYNMQLVN